MVMLDIVLWMLLLVKIMKLLEGETLITTTIIYTVINPVEIRACRDLIFIHVAHKLHMYNARLVAALP
jgi:hypothetical protein